MQKNIKKYFYMYLKTILNNSKQQYHRNICKSKTINSIYYFLNVYNSIKNQ